MKLGGQAGSTWPAVSLEPTDAVDVAVGPVRIAKPARALLERHGP